MLPFDPDRVILEPSKHFRNVKMRKWNWDLHDVRDALRQAHHVARQGQSKVEVWTPKGGSKRLHVVYDAEAEVAFIINGTEGT